MSAGRALMPLSNPVLGQNSSSRYQEDFHELQVQLFLTLFSLPVLVITIIVWVLTIIYLYKHGRKLGVVISVEYIKS